MSQLLTWIRTKATLVSGVEAFRSNDRHGSSVAAVVDSCDGNVPAATVASDRAGSTKVDAVDGNSGCCAAQTDSDTDYVVGTEIDLGNS